jgi:uncharacterized protein
VVFKRRTPRGWLSWARQMIYPDGGFKRATRYVMHRMARLPDDPRRIARGVFAGTFIAFLPIPGMQFLGGWLLAWLMRGNILASLLATFISNPLTTPLIAVFSVGFGRWVLGFREALSPEMIGAAFTDAGSEFWNNITAMFTPAPVRWESLVGFWDKIYWPYFVGCAGPALLLAIILYFATIPLVQAYQNARAKKAKDRIERRRRLRATVAASRGDMTVTDGGDATPPGA